MILCSLIPSILYCVIEFTPKKGYIEKCAKKRIFIYFCYLAIIILCVFNDLSSSQTKY